MILTKLEVASSREFCKYLIPKSVSDEYFDEQTAPTIKKDVIIESDIPADDLKEKLRSILEKNNFEFLKKSIKEEETKDSIERSNETQLTILRFFAEDKFAKQEIGLSATIQKVEEYKSKIYLRVMGNKEWIINEVIKDLNSKLYPLKTVTELLREYSDKIESFIDQIDNLEKFLVINLGTYFGQIEDILDQYSGKQIEKDDFLKQGVQLLGKKFILFFIENLPKAPEEQDDEISSPL
jgi:hypothetical protein